MPMNSNVSADWAACVRGDIIWASFLTQRGFSTWETHCQQVATMLKQNSRRSFAWKNVFSFIVLPQLAPLIWRRQQRDLVSTHLFLVFGK